MFEKLYIAMFEDTILYKMRREYAFQCMDATKRYLEFEKTYPDIKSRLPQNLIAGKKLKLFYQHSYIIQKTTSQPRRSGIGKETKFILILLAEVNPDMLICYDDWVQCESDLIDAELAKDERPIFIYGLSAGGMETYYVAVKNKSKKIKEIIWYDFP